MYCIVVYDTQRNYIGELMINDCPVIIASRVAATHICGWLNADPEFPRWHYSVRNMQGEKEWKDFISS